MKLPLSRRASTFAFILFGNFSSSLIGFFLGSVGMPEEFIAELSSLSPNKSL